MFIELISLLVVIIFLVSVYLMFQLAKIIDRLFSWTLEYDALYEKYINLLEKYSTNDYCVELEDFQKKL